MLGGKDPGVYINAGVQIAQRGQSRHRRPARREPAGVTRGLFFPQHVGQAYYSTRFMGFFLLDPDHGQPSSTSSRTSIRQRSRSATGWPASPVHATHRRRAPSIGVLALYFLGARLDGRPPVPAPPACWRIHLVQVWHARVPNSEILAQPLLLAGLLALAHAHQDDDGFFAPVAGVLLGLLPFARFDGVLAVVLACAGLALHWVTGGRVRWGVRAAAGAALLLFVLYLRDVAGALRRKANRSG